VEGTVDQPSQRHTVTIFLFSGIILTYLHTQKYNNDSLINIQEIAHNTAENYTQTTEQLTVNASSYDM